MSTSRVEVRDLSPMAYAMTRMLGRFAGASIFSPGAPIQPVTPEQTPRQYQYPVGVNMSQQPRRDFPALTPFETLRWLAKQHPLAALCIRVRCEQIALLPGSYVASDKKQQAALQGDCDALNAAMQTPDGQTPLSSWLAMLIRDLLEIDAPCLYRRPDQAGRLAALDVIDGATIKPLLDSRGRVGGYQQVIYGLALSQYLGRRTAPGDELVIGEYAPGELWYQPFAPSSTSPYGRPPMEDLLTYAQIFLRKLDYDLAHFTDGNIPGAMAIMEGQTLDVTQVAAFEENFNAVLQGNAGRSNKLKFIPFPMKIERLNELSEGGRYESAFEEYAIKLVCANYGVTPSEVGFTADVNRATSDGQENIQYRRGYRPLTAWLKTLVFDPVPQAVGLGRHLTWQWDYGESEDRALQATTDKTYFDAGAVSSQELRSLRYPDLEGPAPGVATEAPPTAVADAPDATQDVADVPPILGYHIEAGVVSKNEARARLGLPPEDETADQALRQFQSQLAVMTAAIAAGYPPEDAARLTGAPPIAPGPPQPPPGAPPLALLAKAAGNEAPDKAERDARERSALKLFAGVLQTQLARLTAFLEAAEGDVRAALSGFWPDEAPAVARAVLPFYDELARQAADAGALQLPVGVRWDTVNAAVLDLARAEATRYASEMTETSKAQTSRIVADWVAMGGTLPELTARLEAVYPEARAKMTAATEVTRLYAQGNAAAWQASGVVTAMTWQTANDERVCPECGPLQGKTFAIDAAGALPPAHPNCRCWISPVVRTPDELGRR